MSREIHTQCFYRINGRVLFCTKYTWTVHKDGKETIRYEGFPPEDYAAYVTHKYLVQYQGNWCLISDLEHIPLPEPIQIEVSSDVLIEPLSNREALQEWSDERAKAKEISDIER